MLYVICDFFGEEVEYVWYVEISFVGFDVVLFLGGFFYGDYLWIGVIVKFLSIMLEVLCFVEMGKLVFGVCNGF